MILSTAAYWVITQVMIVGAFAHVKILPYKVDSRVRTHTTLGSHPTLDQDVRGLHLLIADVTV